MLLEEHSGNPQLCREKCSSERHCCLRTEIQEDGMKKKYAYTLRHFDVKRFELNFCLSLRSNHHSEFRKSMSACKRIPVEDKNIVNTLRTG